jgi:tRNA A-37 threonylcarbamoyl transferase component Bud32/Leucine-rich repeat (LRR) protein
MPVKSDPQIKELARSQVYTLRGRVVDQTVRVGGDLDQGSESRRLENITIDQKYKILCLLGEGGMGAVYKAHHLMLNKDVALKTFRSPNLTDDSWRRFQREAQAIARLSHINIVQVFDFGVSEDNVPYYTMECLRGESLAERLEKRGPLSLEQTILIFRQVCSGLSLAHSKGIIHRDLKPGNIFLVNDTPAAGADLVKIVDFGLAGLATDSLGAQKLTAAGTIFGSPLYMSPEQSLGEEVNERSDIYSCGCALFETLTGRPPFRGENAFATMIKHQQSPVPRLSETEDGRQFPQRLNALIAQMLAKNAEDRFQSFDEVSAKLDDILQTQSVKHLPGSQRLAPQKAFEEAGQDDHDTASGGGGSGYLKPVVLACLLVLFAGAITAYLLQPNLAAKAPARQTRAVPVKSAAPQQAFSQYLQNPGAGNSRPRVFQFPTDKSLGNLSSVSGPGAPAFLPCLAQRKVPVPAGVLLALTATEAPCAEPDLFRGFGPDDLDQLTLDSSSSLSWTDTHIKYISRLTGLSYLNINQVEVHDASIGALNQLTRLKTLSIKDTPLAGSALAKLEVLPKLNVLVVSRLNNSTLLECLRNSSNMWHLEMIQCQVSDNDMKIIATMHNLIELNLADNKALTDQGLQSIDNLPNLKSLNIKDTSVSDEGVAKLKVLPQLIFLAVSGFDHPTALRKIDKSKIVHLEMINCNVTNNDLKVIGAMSNLLELYLYDNGQITDQGLRSICNLAKLRTLEIEGTALTYACGETLKRLPSLRHLTISCEKWTPAELASLRKALPKCHIESRKPHSLQSLTGKKTTDPLDFFSP